VDRLAAWLARCSRPIRAAIAIAITVLLTGTIAMLLYGYLIGLPVGSLYFGLFTPSTALTILTVVVVVTAGSLYWLSWRLLVGWNDDERAIPAARGAALWLIFTIVILIMIAVVMVLQVIAATR
jgi:hypothetical protein